ncbi:MAG: SGNH/GDSL hydrolase family protein [Clostridia bacterium]|nr:SGNH/GDSL hydrolase family protein [Clostridia bacterium]
MQKKFRAAALALALLMLALSAVACQPAGPEVGTETTAPVTEPRPEPTLVTDKATYTVGETITVTFTGADEQGSITLMPVDATVTLEDPAHADAAGDGTATLPTSGYVPGEYEVLFCTDIAKDTAKLLRCKVTLVAPVLRKIACLGDSLTNLGEGEKTYVDYLGSETFPLDAQNVGLSGSALGIPAKDGANPALSQRYTKIRDDSDIILIFGGSNDYGHTDFPVTLGDPAAMDDTDRATFSGALRFLITTLREEHPDALIIYVTPPHRNDAVWYKTIGLDREATGINEFGFTLEDYRNAGIAICEAMNCPYIDLYTVPELNPLDEELLKAYYRDGLHLNKTGFEFLAGIITTNVERIWNDVKG